MSKERIISLELKDMLLNNEPFTYAHLIKFERPYKIDSTGKPSTSKEKYTYLTDGSRDVVFDDLSKNTQGAFNGPQNYIANKVQKVSSVSEQTEAKANNFTLVLDGSGIGAFSQGSVVISSIDSKTWDLVWDSTVDLIRAGFREGDKVTLGSIGDFNINSFRANNTLRVTKILNTLTPGALGSLTISLASEEIKSILLDKNAPEYASFINREVFIYRAYFQEGLIVGSPILLFKGIISNVGFEDSDDGIRVSWGLTSHWGDFAQVKGRITSDEFHRALDQNGVPQPQSALKPLYAYDKGFIHAETSINLLATYNVAVEKQDVTYKKGFLGIFGNKVIVKKYTVNEKRNTELDFQLQAKSIPLIYGVRLVPGLPIFADTLANDSSKVYVVYALSEGEIGGIYDVYINSNSLICNDKADFDARSTQTSTETVELICRGRADRGDVLAGVTSISSAPAVNFYYDDTAEIYENYDNTYRNIFKYNTYKPYVPPVSAPASTESGGIIHGESIKLTSPQSITLDVFSGKSGQKAASSLVEIAKVNGFKVQQDYWAGDNTAEYWGPNHTLLDTAYVVASFGIKEGETGVPNLEFIVRGKNLNCYNYDYSYIHAIKSVSENEANFKLGDIVTLYNSSNTIINSSVQIIDKWSFFNPDGTKNTRFRFSEIPNLGYVEGVPSTTSFYMKNSSEQTWTMLTYNYALFSGTFTDTVNSTVISITNTSGNLTINYNSNPNMAVSGDPLAGSPFSRLGDILSGLFGSKSNIKNRLFSGTSTSTSLTTSIPYTTVSSDISSVIPSGALLISTNTAKLPASASSIDDYYKDFKIVVTHYDSVLDKELVQEQEIIAYNGSTKIITIADLWTTGLEPVSGDKFEIISKYADQRVSINSIIQTLDYMTSKTYGRSLDYLQDLNFPSWLAAARLADSRSKVTINTSTAVPSVGSVYKYPATGSIIWQGQTSAVETGYVEFDNVIGKLSNKWNNWKSFSIDTLVYHKDNLYLVTSAGVKTSEPVHTSGTVNGLQKVSAPVLTKVSGTGSATLTLISDGNPVRAQKNGVTIPGYSLYDSDGVDYYKLLGWDSHDQRYVTRHQTNVAIDTSLPLFDNINMMLSHCNAILRYSEGKYSIDIEDVEGAISNEDSEVRNITSDHIIDKILISDEGIRNSFNSLTSAYADPGNKFQARNISFFNSEFLKEDRNVSKKGTITVTGITNYYNTRILADKYLNKSRYGTTVSFNMAPRGMMLLAGTVIQLQYPKYNWVNKKFRIRTLSHQENTTVDIVAEEYDDSIYSLDKISRLEGVGLSGARGVFTGIEPPTNLRTTSVDTGDETYSGVSLTWTNNPIANTRNVYTEVYSSYSTRMYLTVDAISSNVLTTTITHELEVDMQITAKVNSNGLVLNKTYFVKTIPSSTTFTLSETKGGSIVGLTNGTSLGLRIQTGSLIATLPIPTNTYIDPSGGESGRIIKYYWIRHKVIQV